MMTSKIGKCGLTNKQLAKCGFKNVFDAQSTYLTAFEGKHYYRGVDVKYYNTFKGFMGAVLKKMRDDEIEENIANFCSDDDFGSYGLDRYAMDENFW